MVDKDKENNSYEWKFFQKMDELPATFPAETEEKEATFVVLTKDYTDSEGPCSHYLIKGDYYPVIESGYYQHKLNKNGDVELMDDKTEWCQIELGGDDTEEYVCTDAFVKVEDLRLPVLADYKDLVSADFKDVLDD